MGKKITRGKFIATTIGASILSSVKLFANSFDKLMEPYNEAFSMNEKMKLSYELALKALNPTKSQLEHGLELHRNSFVFDAYGFQPTAAVDSEKIITAIKGKASAKEIRDRYENSYMTRYAAVEKERKEFENAWKVSGVTCLFQNAGEEGNSIERLLKRLARFTYTTDMLKDFVSKAATPDDIIKAYNEKKKALYFTGNGVPLPQNWNSLEEELMYIEVFFQLGIRMMHLTYNRRNVIGDGCAEISNGGLSDFGRAVVKEMNRVGVIVDVAHSGWQTSFEAAKKSEKPIVASHSCATAVNNVIRSKPDDVISAIADTDGYIGVCCIPRFLGGTGDISAMMKHIDYIAKKFGVERVAIGTDNGYSSQYSAEANNAIGTATKQPVRRKKWEVFWPKENDFIKTPEMKKTMEWTNWPLFTVGLVQLGYSDSDIQKIIGENVLRVAKAAFV